MDKKTISSAMGGLALNLGKLLQRSRPDPWALPPGMEGEEQPVSVLWTQYTAKSFPETWRETAFQSAFYEAPEKSPQEGRALSLLLSIADKLSTGENVKVLVEKKKQLPSQMVSIFSRMTSLRAQPVSEKFLLPLKELSLEPEALFPGSGAEKNPSAACSKLIQPVMNAVKNFCGDGETDVENLLSALRQETWCIPAAVSPDSFPDVSLYDQARTTAALAVCLQEKSEPELQDIWDALRIDYRDPKQLTQSQRKCLEEPAAILLGGDISGIQNFIYTVTTDKAAKSLRGRSFYLQLLTEVILRFVLQELEIPYTNVIYTGGGHFYLLTPVSAKEKINSLQTKISRILLKHHGTSLYLSLGSAEIPFTGFHKGAFTEYWSQMHSALSDKKQTRYSEFGAEMASLLFEPRAHGGNREDFCSVCGEDKAGTIPLSDGAEGRICPACSSFADDLGEQLPNAIQIRLTLGTPEIREPGTLEDTLAEFGVGLELFSREGIKIGHTRAISAPRRALLWELEDSMGNPKKMVAGLPTAVWRHAIVNRIPRATFDEMQDAIPQGIQRLGVLRMDVDNLGLMFQTGFGSADKSIATLSRLSTLSFQLSVFFEGCLGRLCESFQSIYTVYTGGDDLFLIGPWTEMPKLAQQIILSFQKFTCGNPDFHVSGGMSFIQGKYPIIQAAKDAGEAEEQAKALAGKNAFSFLGEAWKWSQFSELEKKKEQLKNVITALNAPLSILQLVQNLDQQRDQAKKKTYGRWLWMGDYQFTRLISSKKNDPALQKSLVELYEQIGKNYYHDVHEWARAARWAQLELRKQGKGE